MTEKTNIKQQIIDLVLADNYQPLKPRAIAKKLGLSSELIEVRRTIKKLVRSGKLAFGSKHLVIKPKRRAPSRSDRKERGDGKPSKSAQSGKGAPVATEGGELKKSKSNEIVGVFRKTAAGFGFVTPEDSTATDRSEDIFIPKTKTLDAANLDTVQIKFSRSRDNDARGKRKSSHNRLSGRIIKVIKRRTRQFVGSYHETGELGYVVVDRGAFDAHILVGDAGAKRCKIGDKVVIEMVSFPSANSVGEGVIVEVLGDRGTPGVDTLMIIREFGLPEEFPEAVLDDSRKQAEIFDESIPEKRVDFTNKTVITIDPKTARDFDDAISLEQIENGHWQLGVHIADVSHFVPYRSDLDNEAFARGTSVYLPDRVIPMIPEIISNNLASLQPDRVRYSMTALIEFNDEGVPIATELHRGAIKSVHRFNYEEIDDYLENDKPWKKKLTPEVFTLVRDMHTLAMKLRKRRMDNGSINLVLPEVVIDLDDDGRVAGAHSAENTESHQVIEEFMLAANEAVAQYLVDEKLYLLRRIHETPDEDRLKELTKFVRQLGIECGSLQDRFELKKVVEASEGRPESHAIHFAILRSMQKAIYSPKEAGHFALASKAYCHFTSPIRRYPDLVIHRMVGDLIDGKRPKADFDRLTVTGKHCSDLEKRAADAERELKKLKLLGFMEKRIGEKLVAVVTGVEAFGLFAQGIEIPAEGLIPILKLPQDRYKFDKTSKSLTGFRSDNQFRLGDMVEVQVDLVDMDKRIMEFKLIRSLSAAEDKSKGKGKSSATGKSEKSGRKQKAKGAAPFEGAQVGPSRKQKEKQKQKKLDEKKKAKAKPKSKKDKDKKAKAKKEKAAKKKKASKDKAAKDKSGKKAKDKAKKKKKQKKKDGSKAGKPKKDKKKKKDK